MFDNEDSLKVSISGRRLLSNIIWPPLKEGKTRFEVNKTVLVLDLPLQGQCLQQIAQSCHNNLKPFAPTLAIIHHYN